MYGILENHVGTGWWFAGELPKPTANLFDTCDFALTNVRDMATHLQFALSEALSENVETLFVAVDNTASVLASIATIEPGALIPSELDSL
jgi:hypothetical protein